MAHLRLIDEEEATGPLAREYEAAVARAGKVMNVLKAMSLRPAVLRRFLDLNAAVNLEPAALGRAERELLAVVVSVTNGCRYSTRAHAVMLAAEGFPHEEVERVVRDYRTAGLSPLRRALCDFAVQVTLRPASVGQGDVDRLRAHGLGDAAIHDAVQVIAFFNYVNRVVDAVGIEDEPDWTETTS